MAAALEEEVMPLNAAQQAVTNSQKRFRVFCGGRRVGKTFLAIRELARFARFPNKKILYVCPTYQMARDIIWNDLKNKLYDLNWIAKTNESRLEIDLVNGSKIMLRSGDSGQNMRGIGVDFACFDETSLIDSEIWYEVVRPALSAQKPPGSALFCGTPNGFNFFKDLFDLAEQHEDWDSFQFTSLSGGNIPESEIEAARGLLDEKTFKQEYEATFQSASSRLYYAFNREQNLNKYNGQAHLDAVHIGLDFNIDPMSAVVAVRNGDTLQIIDEVRMFSSNTQEMVDELKQRYPQSKLWVYPDPAGAARKTVSSGQTDITILANAGFVVKAPRKHTPVRDRINAVNSLLRSADGVTRLFIDNMCKYTIEGLERQTYKEGTSQPDKNNVWNHQMDALGYMIDYLFPVRRNIDPALLQPQRWGTRVY